MDNLLKAEKKKNTKTEVFLLTFLVILIFGINYSFLDSKLVKFLSTEDYLLSEKQCFVERVVDGDTIIACGNSTRMLGINTQEKNQKYYLEAKNYLANLVENKTIKLVFSSERIDKYGRTLAYVYLENININQEMIKEGFANPYFPYEKDKYFEEFFNSFQECVKEGKNLCKKSSEKCGDCIKLSEFNFTLEKIVLFNQCFFSCDLTNWTIKDEGRKLFVFPEFVLESGSEVEILVSEKTGIYKNKIYWTRTDYIWTDSGDTLFLRDSEGKLVLYKNYF